MEIKLNEINDESLFLTDIAGYLDLSDEEMMDHALSYTCKDSSINIELSREQNFYKLILNRGCVCRFNELVRILSQQEENEIYNHENEDNLPNQYFDNIPEIYCIEVMKSITNREILRFRDVTNSIPVFLGFNYRTNSLVFISRSVNALNCFFAFFLSSYKNMSEVVLKKYQNVFELGHGKVLSE